MSSTTTPAEQAPRTIKLSRDERDFIIDQLWMWTQEDCGSITFATRDDATATLAALHRAFALREELGWTDTDAQTFTATATPALIDLLREVAEHRAESLAHDRQHFDRARAGDRAHWFVGVDTLEETVAIYQREIRSAEHELRICDDVLSRLAGGTGDTMLAAGGCS